MPRQSHCVSKKLFDYDVIYASEHSDQTVLYCFGCNMYEGHKNSVKSAICKIILYLLVRYIYTVSLFCRLESTSLSQCSDKYIIKLFQLMTTSKQDCH